MHFFAKQQSKIFNNGINGSIDLIAFGTGAFANCNFAIIPLHKIYDLL